MSRALRRLRYEVVEAPSGEEALVHLRSPQPPEAALLDMGDFAGGTLKYLRDHPVARLSIAGGFGKLSKLAAGHLDLHSGKSQVDLAGLADVAGDIGGDAALRTGIVAANTANEALELARQAGLPLADAVAARARQTALATLAGSTAVEVLVVDRTGGIAGRAGFWPGR